LKRKQRTISKESSISGVGLHTGVSSEIFFKPAEVNTGIVFRFTKDNQITEIPVTPDTTASGLHRTVAVKDDIEIQTIEHLMAAVAGSFIDNMYIDISSEEVPGADGSAQDFFKLLAESGIVEQEADTNPFILNNPITVSDGTGGVVSAVPYKKGLKLTYTVDYPESNLAQGMSEYELSPEVFSSEISPARTFCLEKHADAMQQQGCGKGASTENTLVLKVDSVVDNELRFSDECARHKLLDLLGDISVVGRPLCMHIVALRSGHKLNADFVEALVQEIKRQENPRGLMDIRDIEATLPHRYPFLLVDRITELKLNESVVGYKNVTRNEEFFEGHFPGQPVMPGVLQIEAMAQTAGVMLLKSLPDSSNMLAVLMSVDGVKYRRPVVPGDKLVMSIKMEKIRRRIGQVAAVATVDGDVTAEAKIKFALVDSDDYT
jgi:UDP-3-O-[3-hydroxymyristoyl] N-acetylglucosamine deacetylase/3-hydroxyacyl-[acyl-carrier-protein] dehydratase